MPSKSLEEARQTCVQWKQVLSRVKFEPGVELEDKEYSLAIHYRRSRKKTAARAQIERALKKLTPAPRVIGGKAVINLLPAGAPHKGAAILDLVSKAGLKHVFYIGDDDTDEDVFGLPYTAGQIMSVRVGKKANSKAAYYLKRQTEINKLIKQILGHHRPAYRPQRETVNEAT